MDPLSIALGLASLVPTILKFLGHDNAAESASKVVGIAQKVTGKTSGEEALNAIKNNPTLALQLQQEIDRHQEELSKTMISTDLAEIQAASANAHDVNSTMQIEDKSEHWQVYSWRPFIGFCFGTVFIVTSLVVACAFGAVMYDTTKIQILSYVGQFITSMATLMAIPLPILGVASWFRGKMQVAQNESKK